MNKTPEQSELYKALVSKRPRSAGSLPCSAAVRKGTRPAALANLRTQVVGVSDFDKSKSRADRLGACGSARRPTPSARSRSDGQRDELYSSYVPFPLQEDSNVTVKYRERTPVTERKENGKIALRACRSSEDWGNRTNSCTSRKFILDSNELSISSTGGLLNNSGVSQGNESLGTLVIVKTEDSQPFERVDEVGPCVAELPSRPEGLQRSVSEDGRCIQDCLPLDLSMSAKRNSVESFAFQNYDLEINSSNVNSRAADGTRTSSEPSVRPKMSLLQLADAVGYIIENDPQSSETFYSSRSSPSSFSDTNSSNSVDEKIILNDYRFSDPAIELLTESREFSADDSKFIKYEMSDSFQPDGIILNSNVLGEKVFCEESLFHPANVVTFRGDAEQSVEQSTPSFGRVLQPHATAQYVHIVSKNSSACPVTASNISKTNSSVTNSRNGGSVMIPSNGVDSKRRLRLAKADYESMSEEDRRVRHRRLDNERSKQYRERRRRMVSSLQTEIAVLEDKNRSLKVTLETLKHRTSIMRAAVEQTMPGCFIGESLLVSAQC